MDWSFLKRRPPPDDRSDPLESCLALPGTAEKEAVMVLRRREGFKPCHPADATWADFARLAFTAPVGRNGRLGEATIILDGRPFFWPVTITPLDHEAVARMAFAAIDKIKLSQDVSDDEED